MTKAQGADIPLSGLSRPLTQIELAKVLGVDRRTIQRALAAGQPLGSTLANSGGIAQEVGQVLDQSPGDLLSVVVRE